MKKRIVKINAKDEVEKNISDKTQQREKIVNSAKNARANWVDEMGKILSMDDQALSFSTDKYIKLTSQLLNKQSLKIISGLDHKRLKYFLEKVNITKFEKRKQLYFDLLIYEIKLINKYFLIFINELTEIVKIPEEKINKEFSDKSDISNNINVILLHTQFMLTTTTSQTLDKMMDRFNYDYDKSLDVLKKEIERECDSRFGFLFLLTNVLKNGNALALEKEKYYDKFSHGKGLSTEKDIKYKKVAGLIKTCELYFNITGVQKIACEIANTNPISFSAWLNTINTKGKRNNYNRFLGWKEDINQDDLNIYKEEINRYLSKYS